MRPSPARDSRNPVFATRFGGSVSLVCPKPEEIAAEDIAFHLARVNRFAGGSDRNVGDHSLCVERLVRTVIAPQASAALLLYALLHDAPEFVYGDHPSPCKRAYHLSLVSHLQDGRAAGALTDPEKRLERAIHRRFGLWEEPPPGFVPIIHQADMMALAWEKRDLNGGVWADQDWGQLPEPPERRLTLKTAGRAARAFLARLAELEPLARAETSRVLAWLAGGAL